MRLTFGGAGLRRSSKPNTTPHLSSNPTPPLDLLRHSISYITPSPALYAFDRPEQPPRPVGVMRSKYHPNYLRSSAKTLLGDMSFVYGAPPSITTVITASLV
jgi:hypothetical protein